jgi:AmmeMemoRadiSam system protein A
MSPLTREDQAALLSLARRAIAAEFSGAAFDLDALADSFASEELRRPAAAFVSLHKSGRLRGCVGWIRAAKPLYFTVAECARAAAFHDNRFEPLAAEELGEIEIEISVLSPFFSIAPEAIEPGTHGVLVTQGFQRGLLLPQVAREFGWGRERFLEETCRKAGLEPDAWRKGASLEAFTAVVFSEATVAERHAASR